MNVYLVTLADRETGADQRVLVQDKNPDRDWQEWVDNADFDPPLSISNPVVMHTRLLRIKRPPRGVLMPTATKVAV